MTGSIVVDPRPTVLYVFSGRSIHKSTDAGTSWAPVDFGRPVAGVSYLAIDPQNTSTIYAGPDSEGLFKSTDDGASWFRPNSTPIVSQLVIDPTNSAALYTNGFSLDFRASAGFGILKSTNGGVSWGPTALQRGGRSSLAIDPETPSTLYAGNADGLYKTTDGGASWSLSLERVIFRALIRGRRSRLMILIFRRRTTTPRRQSC